jgi:hypothetical protein
MTLLRPVCARARRRADIVASVPELTKRTRPMDENASQMARASSISGSLVAP